MDKSMFLLFINDEPFIDLPYQADVIPTGPKNINKGRIAINGKQIHDGFTEYTGCSLENMR